MRNVTLHRFGLLGFLCVLTPVYTVSHSLRAYATLILGETPFPEFSVVVMLDDFQVGYYDMDSNTYISRRYNASWENGKETQEEVRTAFERFYTGMKRREQRVANCLNFTENVSVFQRLAACETVDNAPRFTEGKDVFNGLIGEEVTFDVQKNQFKINKTLPSDCYAQSKNRSRWLFESIYQPTCMKYLTKYLKEERMHDMSNVKPEVRLLKKSLTDSRGVRVTCLATGFYQHDLSLALLRDDQPVSEDQVTGGILLPNGDGTYQMRKSVEVSAEELRQHKYSCRVTHLDLDIRLDMTSDGDDTPATVSIIIYAVVALLVLAMICIISFIIWRKRAGCEHSCYGQYSAPSATTENNPFAE